MQTTIAINLGFVLGLYSNFAFGEARVFPFNTSLSNFSGELKDNRYHEVTAKINNLEILQAKGEHQEIKSLAMSIIDDLEKLSGIKEKAAKPFDVNNLENIWEAGRTFEELSHNSRVYLATEIQKLLNSEFVHLINLYKRVAMLNMRAHYELMINLRDFSLFDQKFIEKEITRALVIPIFLMDPRTEMLRVVFAEEVFEELETSEFDREMVDFIVAAQSLHMSDQTIYVLAENEKIKLRNNVEHSNSKYRVLNNNQPQVPNVERMNPYEN